MAIYHYQSDSPLNAVQILRNDTGGLRAYLYANDAASAEQLAAIQAGLGKHQWKTVPTVQDGKPVLEVRGFKKPEELIAALHQQGATHEVAKVEASVGDNPTAQQKWRNSTLKAAGLSYNVGDAAYMYYTVGDAKKDWNKGPNPKSNNFFSAVGIAGGVGYALGSLTLSVYGSRDQSQNTIQAATQKVQTYLHKNGIVAEDDSPISAITKEPKHGFFKKLDNLFAKYPSETLNFIYLGVGAALSSVAFYKGTRPIDAALKGEALATAIKNRNAERWDVGLGAVTAASALTGILVKEKKIDPQDRREGILGRTLDWIQEKPLRATGIGYGISTMFHAHSTVLKYKSGDITDRRNLIGRAIFVGANVFSEVLLSFSSKGHGVGVLSDKSADQTVLAAAAEMISRQPKAKQEALVHQLAGYIDSSDILSGNSDEIAAQLKVQLHAIETNPWARKQVGAVAVHPESSPPVALPAAVSADVSLSLQRPRTQVTAQKELHAVLAPRQAEAMPAVAG